MSKLTGMTMETAQTDRDVREKLASRGAESLSDAELLSIILQEGVGSQSALRLSEQLLAATRGSLYKISQMNMRSLRMVEGIGVKKAALVLSALELGCRAARENANSTTMITTSDDVVSLFRPLISALPYEEFWVLYLSTANGVLDKVRVSQGGVNHTIVDHKLIVKRAVELLASGIVVVHNHPSGVAQPSAEDIDLTQKIANAASLFEINLLDHLIVTATDSLSFKQLGLI